LALAEPKSIFCHVHAAAKKDLNDSRCAQRELCEAILKRSGENRSFSHKKSGSPAIFALTFSPKSCIIIAVVKAQNFT
jgi:hypothetical protein